MEYKGQEIDSKPTEAMAEEAARGLAWREEFGRGGTEVGVARARDLQNRRDLSADTIRRMYSYFMRHEVDKQGQGFSPGEDGYPSAGRIAWALWGGDPGKSWATERVKRMDKLDEESRSEYARPYPNEHAARLKDPVQYDSFRREANAGGPGIDFIYGIKDGNAEIQAIRFDEKRYTEEEAKKWLADNDFSPIQFEAAIKERSNMDMEQRHIKSVTETEDSVVIEFSKEMDDEPQEDESIVEEIGDVAEDLIEMSATIERSDVKLISRADDMMAEMQDDRRVRMAISSEMPVEREFGIEILDHTAQSIDLSFLNSGRAPLLLDHDPERQIGVIETVTLDDSARRLRATVRFGKGSLASEVYSDVADGIRGNVSIGYRINKMAKDEMNPRAYRAVSWMPMEVSVVSIPADQSVGVGRSAEIPQNLEVKQTQPEKEIKMDQTNVEVVSADAAVAKRNKEIAEILNLAVKHNQRDLANDCIGKGMTIEQFRGTLLEKIADKPLETPDVGMSAKEVRQYSIVNAIKSAASGRFSGLEAEVAQELARKYGKEARGFYVPTDIFKRDIATTSTYGAGSNLVGTDHLAGEFIDALRANLVISGLGARMLQGLKGDVAIPAMNAKTAVGFVAENAAPGTEGAPSFRQVTMSPKTLVQYVDISRKLMMQSDPSVEQLVRDDMSRQFAAKIDEVAIEGGGASEPTGILGTNGIGSVGLGTNGAALTYAALVALEREVAIDNALAGRLAYLTNPKVVAAMRTTSRQASGVEGNFILNDTNRVLGYDVVSTTLVPSDLSKGTGSDLSAVVFGNFSDLIIGMFGGLDILVDPYTGSSTGATRVAMYQDIDVAVRHAESFAAIKDVIAA